MEVPHPELLEGNPNPEELRARIGRWAVMEALGVNFTEDKMVQISRNEMKGYAFWGAVHKTWAGITGNGNGICKADAEIEAEILGVFDDVFGYDSI